MKPNERGGRIRRKLDDGQADWASKDGANFSSPKSTKDSRGVAKKSSVLLQSSHKVWDEPLDFSKEIPLESNVSAFADLISNPVLGSFATNQDGHDDQKYPNTNEIFAPIDQPWEIPNADEIERMKRLRLEQRNVDDYMPLVMDKWKHSSTDKRLELGEKVSYDDYNCNDEDEDVRGRIIDMGVQEEVFDSHRGNRIMMNIIEDNPTDLAKMDISDIEPDEELARWEVEQIKKGTSGGIRQVSTEVTSVTKQLTRKLREPRNVEESIDIQAQLDAILLEQERLQQSQETIQTSMDRISSELQSTNAKCSIQLIKIEELNAQNEFFQSIKWEIEEICYWMDTNMALLDQAEDRILSLYSDYVQQLIILKPDDTLDKVLAIEQPNFLLIQNKLKESFEEVYEFIDALWTDARMKDPSDILRLLGDWKARFPEWYEQSYVDIELTKLVEPSIRRWLLQRWNPFVPVCEYHYHVSFSLLIQVIGHDTAAYLNRIVNEIAIPKALSIVEAGFSPLVVDHCMAILTICNEFTHHVQIAELKERMAQALEPILVEKFVLAGERVEMNTDLEHVERFHKLCLLYRNACLLSDIFFGIESNLEMNLEATYCRDGVAGVNRFSTLQQLLEFLKDSARNTNRTL